MKVAVVTGAGSGIGRACAERLAARGHALVCGDLDAAAATATAGAIEAAGGEAVAVPADVRRKEDVVGLVEEAERRGGLGVMVANAAVSVYVPFEEMPEDQLDLVLDTDLRGALLCAQASIPAMRAGGGGSIVLVSSVQAFVTLPGCVPYAAAKAGLVAAARALAPEVGAAGIRVNAVAPGTIDTPMLRRDLAGMNRAQATAFLERVSGANALGRVGTAEEVADVVCFLASEESRYVTGTTLVVDGGYLTVKSF
ncbi:MAG: SDR family NAD(P)-dependent oxidoreductase [Gaiella sp.]